MKNIHFALNPFTIDPKEHSSKSALSCPEPTLTVQADKQQSDINYIVKQFGVTGELPYGLAVPSYDDYSDIPNDYHAALSFIQESDEKFMQMPADVRSRFNNDAGLFLDFISNPANRKEAYEFGFTTNPPAGGLPIPDNGSPEPNATGA